MCITVCPWLPLVALGNHSLLLFVLGYHWLPLATIDLVGDNREFEVWAIFWGLIPIIDSLITIIGLLLYNNNQYEPACGILSLLDIWDNSVLFEDLWFVETLPTFGWVGGWISGWVHVKFVKNWINHHLIKIIEFCLKICGDTPTYGWVDRWVIVFVSGLGSCQISKSQINCYLIEIIEFWFMICEDPIPPTQSLTILGYSQISNTSIGLDLIKIIQFCLKIWILWKLLHPWMGEWFDGWIKGWRHVKSLKIK